MQDTTPVEWVRCAEGNYPEFAERYRAMSDRRVTEEDGWFQAWMPVDQWDTEEDGPVPVERRTFGPADDPMWGVARTLTLANTLARSGGTVTVGTWVLRDLVDLIDSLQRALRHSTSTPPRCAWCGQRQCDPTCLGFGR